MSCLIFLSPQLFFMEFLSRWRWPTSSQPSTKERRHTIWSCDQDALFFILFVASSHVRMETNVIKRAKKMITKRKFGWRDTERCSWSLVQVLGLRRLTIVILYCKCTRPTFSWETAISSLDFLIYVVVSSGIFATSFLAIKTFPAKNRDQSHDSEFHAEKTLSCCEGK